MLLLHFIYGNYFNEFASLAEYISNCLRQVFLLFRVLRFDVGCVAALSEYICCKHSIRCNRMPSIFYCVLHNTQ